MAAWSSINRKRLQQRIRQSTEGQGKEDRDKSSNHPAEYFCILSVKVLVDVSQPSTDEIQNGQDETERGSETPFDDRSTSVVNDSVAAHVVAIVCPGARGVVRLKDSADDEAATSHDTEHQTE